MRPLFILTLLTLSLAFSYGQQKVRPAVWFGPADNVNVCGLNLSPLVYKLPVNSTINGINIEGIGMPVFSFMVPQDPVDDPASIKIRNDFNVNGLTVAPLGLLHKGIVNGVAATSWFSIIDQVNGVNLALLGTVELRHNGVTIAGYYNSTCEMSGVQIAVINTAKSVRGVQLGLINRTTKLDGLQIGLWNINENRKLPLVNW